MLWLALAPGVSQGDGSRRMMWSPVGYSPWLPLVSFGV